MTALTRYILNQNQYRPEQRRVDRRLKITGILISLSILIAFIIAMVNS